MKRLTFIPFCVVLLLSASLFAAPKATGFSKTLADSSANDSAKKLYKYLCDIYGKKIVTGQMENAWNDDCNMLNRVYADTKKYPALMGFDFMNYTGATGSSNKQTERAIKFWNGQDWNGNKISDNHGIVAFCWHWRSNAGVSGNYGSFRAEETSFRIPYDTAADSWKQGRAYKKMVSDLNVIADELLELQEAGVPVLWRPLHEGAGNLGGGWAGACAWFWWGAGSSTEEKSANGKKAYKVSDDVAECGECYVALWRFMFDYFTKEKGIHNLIWVWNGQNKAFYPGDEYVDIIGDDIYDKSNDSVYKNHGSHKKTYEKFRTQMGSTNKIVALTECGYLPHPKACYDDGAMWSFFMIWNDGDSSGGKVTKKTSGSNFWSGEYYNSAAKKIEIYNNEYAVTLDTLPDLTAY